MNVDQRTGRPRLLLRAGRGEVVALGDLYDQHGAGLYRLALALSRDARTAESAVCEAFQLACVGAERAPTVRLDWHQLAGYVFAACRGAWADRDATVETHDAEDMLALTLHGGHTYRGAAFLLRLDAPTAAALLRSSLLALSAVSREKHPGDQR